VAVVAQEEVGAWAALAVASMLEVQVAVALLVLVQTVTPLHGVLTRGVRVLLSCLTSQRI
jgi:putative aminopeptidase FrvX